MANPCSTVTQSPSIVPSSAPVPSGDVFVYLGPPFTTPRDYSGTVSIVISSVAKPRIVLGELAASELPACAGQPVQGTP